MDHLRKFLLGELNETEKSALEERIFLDDTLFDELRAAEDELISAYVQGELPRRQRRRFQKYFLALPSSREKLAFVQTLHRAVENETPKAASLHQGVAKKIGGWLEGIKDGVFSLRPATQLAGLAVLLLLGVNSAWLFHQISELQEHVTALTGRQRELLEASSDLRQQLVQQNQQAKTLSEQLTIEEKRRKELEQELARLSQDPGEMLAFLLEPGRLRADEGERHRLRIPATARHIRLQLIAESVGQATTYRAILRSVSGEEVWSRSGLDYTAQPWGVEVWAELPASVLASDDYILTLSGREQNGPWYVVARYSFGVLRQ